MNDLKAWTIALFIKKVVTNIQGRFFCIRQNSKQKYTNISRGPFTWSGSGVFLFRPKNPPET